MTTTRRPARRPAGPRISWRLVLLVVAVFAFPWAIPMLAIMALGLAFLVLGMAAALVYAAALVVEAHAVLFIAAALLVALAATALRLHSTAKLWGQLGLVRG